MQQRLIAPHRKQLAGDTLADQPILSISYDDTLLQTRHLLLQSRGHEVVSAHGFTNSMEQCAFPHWKLLIMGHSIPERDKRALMREFRKNCAAPVLALHRLGEPVLEGAEHTIVQDHPEQLLTMVEKVLSGQLKKKGVTAE